MAVSIEQVPLWVMMRGIGHVVIECRGTDRITPHSLIMGGVLQKRTPARICKECRDALAHCAPATAPVRDPAKEETDGPA